MQYSFTQPDDDIVNWAYWEGAFSAAEVEAIVDIGERLPQETALTAGARTADTDIRKSMVAWIRHGRESDWLFRRLEAIAHDMNRRYFRFDLSGLREGLQYTSYPGNADLLEAGHYVWHTDRGRKVSWRKLSICVQLSDPAQYEGGELELFVRGDAPSRAPKGLGMAVAFPSFVPHRVTPVIAGLRRSLVCWVAGPPLR